MSRTCPCDCVSIWCGCNTVEGLRFEQCLCAMILEAAMILPVEVLVPPRHTSGHCTPCDASMTIWLLCVYMHAHNNHIVPNQQRFV